MDFIRLINSTKYGSIAYHEKLRKILSISGYNVFDGKTFSLYRFAAWYFDYFHERDEKHFERQMNRIESQRELTVRRQRAMRALASDIGEIPACENPERVEQAKDDFVFFCKTYFPDVFFNPFNENHLKIARECERVVKKGGKQGIAAPRGFCKTAFLRAAIAYAFLCFPERHKYLIFLGATEVKTKETRMFLYRNFCNNPMIAADFPQVSYPLQCYNDSGRSSVTYKGQQVDASWMGSKFQLPVIEGSPQSGVAIQFHSINTESLRGQDHIVGTVAYRPSIVFVDDPQNVKAAESEARVDNLKNIVFKEVEELSGFDGTTNKKLKMGVLVACTCIAQNDFAMHILDHKANPDYRGIKISRMIQMPHNMRLWEHYRELRSQSLIDHADIRLATEFYREHQSQMDDGAVTITPDETEEEHLSGIQYAMDKWAKNAASFYTEQQNDPERAAYVDSVAVTPAVIRDKMIYAPRLYLPENTFAMTAFIDAGKNYHAYEVCAFGANRSFSHTLDYGIWPDQGVPKITKQSYRIGIQEIYSDRAEKDEERIGLALRDLLDKITNQIYFDHRGKEISVNEVIDLHHERYGQVYQRLAMIGIDCRYCEDTVWKSISVFVSEHPEWRDRIIPTYGTFAQSRLLRYYDLDMENREWQRGRNLTKNGRSNYDWIENPRQAMELFIETGLEYSLKYDANTFKTMAAQAWLIGKGFTGTHTIFDHVEYKMYAEHQCSEKPVPTTINGIAYNKWKAAPGAGGNMEFLDTRVGCEAIANYVGIEEKI